jgi:endonuclease YncB( thermonuclease family)
MTIRRAFLPVTRRSALLAFGGVVLSACARKPDALALAPGETGRITRVADGDLLILDTGLNVRLTEIEAPQASRRSTAPYGEQARAVLRTAAEGHSAQLYYGGLTRDRYGRALAHVIATHADGKTIWLNGMMVRAGAARVRSWPDNAARVRELYALEAEARAARRGLWALDDYRIRSTSDLSLSPGFTVVEGKLTAFTRTERFGDATVSADGIALALPAEWGEPEGLALTIGAPVRLRGRIEDGAMRVSHWGQIETP